MRHNSTWVTQIKCCFNSIPILKMEHSPSFRFLDIPKYSTLPISISNLQSFILTNIYSYHWWPPGGAFSIKSCDMNCSNLQATCCIEDRTLCGYVSMWVDTFNFAVSFSKPFPSIRWKPRYISLFESYNFISRKPPVKSSKPVSKQPPRIDKYWITVSYILVTLSHDCHRKSQIIYDYWKKIIRWISPCCHIRY